jgi:hypothetical protein
MRSRPGLNGFGEDKTSCLYQDRNRGPPSPYLVPPGHYHYKNLTGQKADKRRGGYAHRGSLKHELTNKHITETCITTAHRPDNVSENIMCSAVENGLCPLYRRQAGTGFGSVRLHPNRISLATNCSYTSITFHKMRAVNR